MIQQGAILVCWCVARSFLVVILVSFCVTKVVAHHAAISSWIPSHALVARPNFYLLCHVERNLLYARSHARKFAHADTKTLELVIHATLVIAHPA